MPGRMSLTKEEREYYYDAIAALDENKDYVVCDKDTDTLSYTFRIKINENIMGRPADEELTRALIVVNLIKNYGYSPKQMVLEDSVQNSGRNITTNVFQNDIAILDTAGIVYEKLIEVKRITDYHGINDREIYTQLFHPFGQYTKYQTVKELYYVSCDIPMTADEFPLVCVGIDAKKAKTYKEWDELGKPSYFIDIVKNGMETAKYTCYMKLKDQAAAVKGMKDLNDNFGIDTIRRAWRTIWDAIWGGNLESNKKFENFNKILLAKIYDEKKTPYGVAYGFQRKIRAGELQDNRSLAEDINLLYKKAHREYLSKNMNIDLRDIKGIDFNEFSYDLTAVCVEQLHSYSFARNLYKNVDILGEFYEMVIRDSFKQTKGLFLTHPNIVLFILSVLDVEGMVKEKLHKPDEDTRYRLPFVIDPSCGTGTFLVYYMNYVQKYIDENSGAISNGDIDVDDFIKREVQGANKFKWVKDYVFGLDNEPVLAVASQINQILHGDGSTNIYCADGLQSFASYANLDIIGAHNILSSGIVSGQEFYTQDVLGKFDLIISNPPFNVNVNKSRLGENFDITGKSEAYFLERWYQLLKPKGRIGVVLPESFFSVEDDVDGRIFLYKHFNIKCIVALPNFTFLPYTPTSTSLLFAEKKSIEEEKEFFENWEKQEKLFAEKLNKIIALFPRAKSEVDGKRIRALIQETKKLAVQELGKKMVVFPYFSGEYLDDVDNYSNIKRKIRDAVSMTRERWILQEVYKALDEARGEKRYVFTNYSVENIGYKAGKKGAKDKPNELMSVYTKDEKVIYNVKYAHDWNRIDESDLNTVLGMVRKENIWQS